MSNTAQSAAERIRNSNKKTNTSWINLSFQEGRITSKDPELNRISSLTMVLEKLEIVRKDEFTTKDGKVIPAQDHIRLHGKTFIGESDAAKIVCCDLPLQDRFRTCNVFLNKLALALQNKHDWDGIVRVGAYRKEDNGKMYVNFFETCDNAAYYAETETNFFPYDEEARAFSGVPAVLPAIGKNGKPIMSGGKPVYDTAEFDAFYSSLAHDLCTLLSEFWAEKAA